MVQFTPPPDPHALLPPLLACLPLAFVSPRPPPALLPLLSPILRQRVQLLSGTTQNESWLPLLCWDREKATNLAAVINTIELEPHPASGEIELGDVKHIRYRRRDEETLEARIKLSDLNLLPVYLWCMPDATTGEGPGWRLTELRTIQDYDDEPEDWFPSMDEARRASKAAYISDALRKAEASIVTTNNHNHQNMTQDDDDDDDYWNMYDCTPGRTPAKNSPAPQVQRPASSTTQQQHSNLVPSTEEFEYFARYAAEVQPALDAHDPEEEVPADAGFESTLHGDTLTSSASAAHVYARNGGAVQFEPTAANIGMGGYDSSLPATAAQGQAPHADGAATEQQQETSPFETLTHSELNHPQPVSGSGSPASASSSVARIEAAAAGQAAAEVAIKQHISTDLKSLYRLARGVGIARDEFERIVRTELDVLGMMGLDDE